jgi:hypothetical protein
MPPKTPIGLIGVGLTGEVYAQRLIAAGFGVIGFDVDPARAKRLTQIGGRAGSLADIARHCDPVVVAVFSTDQVEEVVERALVPAAPGKIVICTSTCDPDRIAALGARVAQAVPLPRSSGLRHQRAGAAGRRRRFDRRRRDHLSNFRKTHQISPASREIFYALFNANSDRQAASRLAATAIEASPAATLTSARGQVGPDVELTRCFLRLCNLPDYALDRLSRYVAPSQADSVCARQSGSPQTTGENAAFLSWQ